MSSSYYNNNNSAKHNHSTTTAINTAGITNKMSQSIRREGNSQHLVANNSTAVASDNMSLQQQQYLYRNSSQ